MSIEGYFEGVLRNWDRAKHTPGMVNDMKTVLRQFDTSITLDEISNEKKDILSRRFNQIRKEVYK